MSGPDQDGVLRTEIEVLGTAETNDTPDSTHPAKPDASHLWSYAQEAALLAVCELKPGAKAYTLITDPERRAQRIAGHYAKIYFASAERSKGKVQFYWPALAAFVVKDIVYAYRYARKEVLEGGWRTTFISSLGSEMMSGAMPYEHAIRTYDALAKGNLWLFMDIYPSLWFYWKFVLQPDGSAHTERVGLYAQGRNSGTYQEQTRNAVEQLPFGRPWLGKLNTWLAGDQVYAQASKAFGDGLSMGGTSTEGAAFSANQVVKQHRAEMVQYDKGFLSPPNAYWPPMAEPYYVLDESRREWQRIIDDGAASGRLDKIKIFPMTKQVLAAYQKYEALLGATQQNARRGLMEEELVLLAGQEQINVLQPLIYEDPKLKTTLDLNHSISRNVSERASAPIRVIFSAEASADAAHRVDFDESTGRWDSFTRMVGDTFGSPTQSLCNLENRMAYVKKIAAKFNRLMSEEPKQMEAHLRIIEKWHDA